MLIKSACIRVIVPVIRVIVPVVIRVIIVSVVCSKTITFVY